MDESTVRETLRSYITRELMREPGYPLADDESIIKGRLIDSFALAQIGVLVEQEFGVYIPDPDLTANKMDTLDLMTARVMRG